MRLRRNSLDDAADAEEGLEVALPARVRLPAAHSHKCLEPASLLAQRALELASRRLLHVWAAPHGAPKCGASGLLGAVAAQVGDGRPAAHVDHAEPAAVALVDLEQPLRRVEAGRDKARKCGDKLVHLVYVVDARRHAHAGLGKEALGAPLGAPL